jgi:hypothetical protein
MKSNETKGQAPMLGMDRIPYWLRKALKPPSQKEEDEEETDQWEKDKGE